MCSGICRYIWYAFGAKAFRFHIESWPEWDSNPLPRAYRAHDIYIYTYIYIYIYIYLQLNKLHNNTLQNQVSVLVFLMMLSD